MPGQKQREPFVLKHRLTGAAVLIGFAVIVLPLLLGSPGGDGQNSEEAGSSAGDSATRVFRSNITPIGGATPAAQDPDAAPEEAGGRTVAELLEESGGEPESGQSGGDAAAGGEDGSGGGQSAAAPAPEPDEETAPTAQDAGGEQLAAVSEQSVDAAPSEPEPAKQIDRGWIVQVGTFRNPGNVEKLIARLESNGFGSSTTDVQTSEGPATRVWVGPFETRVEAARAKTRVKQRIGSEGLIVAYP